MTQEEKAKAYDKALERAKIFKEHLLEINDKDYADEMNYIFPELRESEDERIRKELITYFRNIRCVTEEGAERIAKWIAWLEKQGEQILANSAKTGKDETKFHKGQWIVWQDKCYKVNYNGCGYELVDQNGLSTSLEYGTVDENAHIWDITKDARVGDVLASKDKSNILIFRNLDTSTSFSSYYNTAGKGELGWSNECFIPATKEQRNQLEKAMVNAGYTFDFEKKEPKKIEQMSSWSEEDKNFMYDTLSNLTELKDRYGEGYGNVGNCIKWLKSLKERIER